MKREQIDAVKKWRGGRVALLGVLILAVGLYEAGLEEVKHSDFSPQAASIARRAILHNQQFR